MLRRSTLRITVGIGLVHCLCLLKISVALKCIIGYHVKTASLELHGSNSLICKKSGKNTACRRIEAQIDAFGGEGSVTFMSCVDHQMNCSASEEDLMAIAFENAPMLAAMNIKIKSHDSECCSKDNCNNMTLSNMTKSAETSTEAQTTHVATKPSPETTVQSKITTQGQQTGAHVNITTTTKNARRTCQQGIAQDFTGTTPTRLPCDPSLGDDPVCFMARATITAGRLSSPVAYYSCEFKKNCTSITCDLLKQKAKERLSPFAASIGIDLDSVEMRGCEYACCDEENCNDEADVEFIRKMTTKRITTTTPVTATTLETTSGAASSIGSFCLIIIPSMQAMLSLFP